MIELMMKIEDSFRKEKEITVNISHELMTPISVMRSKLEYPDSGRNRRRDCRVIEESLKPSEIAAAGQFSDDRKD